MKYLGIDFGTTFTKAAIFDSVNNQTILVELNPENTDFGFGKTRYAMPTVVLVRITPYNRSYEVGHKAQNMKRYPSTYVFESFKTSLDSEDDYIQHSPDISYIELIQAVLTHVYNAAKLQTLSDVDKVVITIPASTIKNSPRWMRMLTAAHNTFGSKMDVEIIYEPEAAGFALLDESLKRDNSLNEQKFLVYDFGGGTFDASVFQVIDEQIFVIGESVGSDDQRRWGGVYIDYLIRKDYRRNGSIINTLLDGIESKDLREQMKIEEILRMEPIKAKIALSSQKSYTFSLMDYTLSSKRFEEIIRPMVDDTIAYSQNLIDSKEEEGSEMSLNDINRIFLVGGTSRIKMISESWSQLKHLSNGGYKYGIDYANIEVVAIGAAKYNHLRISSDRLIELGVVRLSRKDYNRAAMYFRNANTSYGNYLLGLLYYDGLIGSKRNYRKAIHYFKLSDNEQSNAMLAKCSFQGRLGLPRNHEMAKSFLLKAGKLDLAKKISSAISSNSPNQETLDEIYNFDAIKEELSNFEIGKLQNLYTQSETSKKTEESTMAKLSDGKEVKPCSPDLSYSDLMNLASRLFSGQ